MSKPAVKEVAAPPKAKSAPKKVAQVICVLYAHSFNTDKYSCSGHIGVGGACKRRSKLCVTAGREGGESEVSVIFWVLCVNFHIVLRYKYSEEQRLTVCSGKPLSSTANDLSRSDTHNTNKRFDLKMI